MAVVATVLAIACVNLAGLFMARGLSRRGELAVRAALGASRGRIVRQLVIESLVLSAGGGAVGLLIAYWATQALAALAGGALTAETAAATRLDARCLLFTFAASAATALAFGLIPAREASQVDPQVALRDRARGGTADRRHHRVRRLLVVTEVALAVVLLVGAGLLLRTLSNLGRVDLGFQSGRDDDGGPVPRRAPAGDPERRARADPRSRQAVPGVKAAGTIQFLPLRGAGCGTGFWREDHAADQDPSHSLPTDCGLVSRGYFTAMGIPVVAGRPFDRGDRLDRPARAGGQPVLRPEVLSRRAGAGQPHSRAVDRSGARGDRRGRRRCADRA